MSNNLFGTNFHHHWEGGWWCHFSTSHLKQQEDGCFDTLISSLGQLVVELLTFVFKPLKEGCTSYYDWSFVQSQDVSWVADFFKKINNTGVFNMCFKIRKHFWKKMWENKKDTQLCPCYVVYFVLDIKTTVWHWQHFFKPLIEAVQAIMLGRLYKVKMSVTEKHQKSAKNTFL